MQSGLYERDTIAGAVAREINRLEFAPTKQIEGLAYKAAFDRKGSDAVKHITSFINDVQLINNLIIKIHCPRCGLDSAHCELIDGETCPRCRLVL